MRSMLVIILISFEVVLGFDYYWRDYNGTTHSDAFEDPDSGLNLAQISIIEKCPGLSPAGLNPISKQASAECYHQKISTTENIKVLCSENPEGYYWEWITVVHVNTRDGFVKGGHQTNAGDLYFGKLFKKNVWLLGKVVFDYYPGCYFFDEEKGERIVVDDCMILKYR